MKKIIHLNNKWQASMFASLILLIIGGCNMKNDNTNAEVTDSTIVTTTSPINDSVTAAIDTSNNTITAKDTSTIKKKKGKVTIKENAASTGKMEMNKEGLYTNVEVMPAFPGGQKSLENYFNENIAYPERALENGTEGTVNVTFAVDENGKLYSPKVTGDKIGDGIEDEALRVVKQMPTWTPGKIKGKNVKTQFSLPVTFTIF